MTHPQCSWCGNAYGREHVGGHEAECTEKPAQVEELLAEVDRLKGQVRSLGELAARRESELIFRRDQLSRAEVLRAAADALREDDHLLAAEELREMADAAEQGTWTNGCRCHNRIGLTREQHENDCPLVIDKEVS